jgi:hypothetical protein
MALPEEREAQAERPAEDTALSRREAEVLVLKRSGNAGDYGVGHYRWRGIHEGEFAGIPVIGRAVDATVRPHRRTRRIDDARGPAAARLRRTAAGRSGTGGGSTTVAVGTRPCGLVTFM